MIPPNIIRGSMETIGLKASLIAIGCGLLIGAIFVLGGFYWLAVTVIATPSLAP